MNEYGKGGGGYKKGNAKVGGYYNAELSKSGKSIKLFAPTMGGGKTYKVYGSGSHRYMRKDGWEYPIKVVKRATKRK